MEYRILGPLELTDVGQEIHVTAPMLRRLVLSLLVRRNETVSVDRLVEDLWPADPPATAQKAVRVYVSQLRKQLGERALETHPAGYRLRVDSHALDAARFERLLVEGRSVANPELAAAIFRRALGLWRGPALADAAYTEFGSAEAARLEELRLDCLEERIAAELELGNHDDVLPELTTLVREQPLRERARSLLMLAYYRAGRQAEALTAYRDACRLLDDELGIEPGEELRSLHQAILRHDVVPPDTNRARDSVRLPVPATPLVGRDRERGELRAWVERVDVRLISLVGAGGSGKTRLALAVASDCAGLLANGVVFVELAALKDPELVLPTIARACGVAEVAEEAIADRLAAWLAERELLLIVDNIEHVIDASSQLAHLVRAAPRMTVLVTSRAVLHVSGEHVFPVPPLERDDAIALFAARARSLDPTWTLTPETTPLVEEICRRLDCLPLALELGASHTRTLTPKSLLEQLERRSDLGAVGVRDLPARQQTLRAVLAWSTDLLGESERRDLARLGVFAGGFTVASAESVAGSELRRLATLVDSSLVQRDPSSSAARFSMLETIREQALERLGRERDDVERRHALYFADFAEALDDRFYGSEQTAVAEQFDAEHDNVRAALATFRRQARHDGELRLVGAMWNYWWVRGHVSEGRQQLELALASSTGTGPRVQLKALQGAAALADRQHDYDTSRRRATEARGLARTIGDARGEANALTVLHSALNADEAFDEAAELLMQAEALFRSVNDARGQARTLVNLGNVELLRGRFEEAKNYSRESVRLYEELGHTAGLAAPMCNIGLAALAQGRLVEARENVQESLRIICQLGHVEYVANALDALAAVDTARGSGETAARTAGAAAALRAEAESRPDPFEAALQKQTDVALGALLGRDRLEELFAQGRDEPWQLVAERLG